MADRRPHLLLIMTDQQRGDCLGIDGHPVLQTPHLDFLAHCWTGPIGRSRTGLPFFGALDGWPDVLFGVGYSGNGVGPSVLGGRILASLALGRDDEWAGCGLVGLSPGRFPPEPFRFLGGLAVRTAIERKERADDASRRPGRLCAALARLAPPGLVPDKRN